MPTEPTWPAIAECISAATGESFTVERRVAVEGGSVSAAYRIEGSGRRYFVKLGDSTAQLEAEAAGLAELARAGAIRVPRVVAVGGDDESSWLALEYIELGRGTADSMTRLGKELAALHRVTTSRFGWMRDNTIGTTPQVNTPADDWVEFFRERRLRFQLELAAQKSHRHGLQVDGERLLAAMGAFFDGYAPQPSLLHGDLWSGNVGFDETGAPVLFDPAVYYGDREADLAMTRLFGGFGRDFYRAYEEELPLDPGFERRCELYNLYHILNHYNLFGGGYLGQALAMMERLLAEA